MNSQNDESSRSLHHLSFSTESLESRTLLDAASSNIVSALSFSIGLPIASLATGSNLPVPASMASNANQTVQEVATQEITNGPDQPVPGIGLAMPAQTLQGFTTSVSLPLVESTYGGAPVGGYGDLAIPFGQPYNGPAPALRPPGYATESAIAAASEVRLPTPGRTDRISSIARAIPIIPLPHYQSPDSEMVTKPEVIQLPPAAAPIQHLPDQAVPNQAVPDQPAVEPPPVIDRDAAPRPEAAPAVPKGPMAFDTFDEAIGLVETDLAEVHSSMMPCRPEQSMALGALLAAWGGWNVASRQRGKSKQRPLVVTGLEAGPGRSGDSATEE